MSRQNDADNHSNQLNPNNDAYWESRGWDERPDDWEEQVVDERSEPVRSEDRGSDTKGR